MNIIHFIKNHNLEFSLASFFLTCISAGMALAFRENGDWTQTSGMFFLVAAVFLILFLVMPNED